MLARYFYIDSSLKVYTDRELKIEQSKKNPIYLQTFITGQSQCIDHGYDPNEDFVVNVYILDSNASGVESKSRVSKVCDFIRKDEQLNETGDFAYISGIIGNESLLGAEKVSLVKINVGFEDGRRTLGNMITGLSLLVEDAKITQRPSLAIIPLTTEKIPILNLAIEAVINEGIQVISSMKMDDKDVSSDISPAASGPSSASHMEKRSDDIDDAFTVYVKLNVTELVIEAMDALSYILASDIMKKAYKVWTMLAPVWIVVHVAYYSIFFSTRKLKIELERVIQEVEPIRVQLVERDRWIYDFLGRSFFGSTAFRDVSFKIQEALRTDNYWMYHGIRIVQFLLVIMLLIIGFPFYFSGFQGLMRRYFKKKFDKLIEDEVQEEFLLMNHLGEREENDIIDAPLGLMNQV